MRARHHTNHPSESQATSPLRRVRWASLLGLLVAALAGGALLGCGSMMARSGVGATPTRVPVLRYDWAGRRGDEVEAKGFRGTPWMTPGVGQVLHYASRQALA